MKKWENTGTGWGKTKKYVGPGVDGAG